MAEKVPPHVEILVPKTMPGDGEPTPTADPPASRQSRSKRQTRSSAAVTAKDRSKQERDGLIMATNNSSIVSKRSVEKLYYEGQPEYFRYFVSKLKRRSPLINRGYWLRMKAIEHAVAQFLTERTAKKRIVVNLGCGYDPLPFWFLGKRPELCSDAIFIDVDYPELMRKKLAVVEKTDQIRALVPDFTLTAQETGLLGSCRNYAMIACDLIDAKPLKTSLRDDFHAEDSAVSLLFVSEVATAYMEVNASQAVFEWTATYPDARFVLLEQHVPDGLDHPFAQTMMAHFDKLRTPLRAVGTMEQMKQRFTAAGFPEQGVHIRSLWELWSDPLFLTDEQRLALDIVEPFDEWEEYALYASHYFLLVADKMPADEATHAEPSSSSLSDATIAHNTSLSSVFSFQNPPSDHILQRENALQTYEFCEPHDFRRFAAVVPSSSLCDDHNAIGLLGGMGTRERTNSCNTYARADNAPKITPPPLRTGIMCHTITTLGTTTDCMLIGGRTSPDKAIAQTWLRQDGKWRPVASLPCGRYRHCAVPLHIPNTSVPAQTVLVFGGKTSDGDVLDEWLIWAGESGWRRLSTVGKAPSARFGAAMITDGREGLSGVLVGGMTRSGRVLADFWHWELAGNLSLRCHNVTTQATAILKDNACILGRYAAQLVRSDRGTLMIGGITGGRMLTRHDEILNMKTLRPQPLEGPRPLLIGCSIQDIDGGLLVLGGGATCFSFGTTWNRSCIIGEAKPGSPRTEWRLVGTESPGILTAQKAPSHAMAVNGTSVTGMPTPQQVQRVRMPQDVNFDRLVERRRPMVFTDCDIGPCTAVWNNNYLKEAVGADRPVSVHVASTEKMDFQTKNFEYRTQEFGGFLDAIQRGEKLYLRSLSKDAPSENPTSLADDFPELADDFKLPPELATATANAHSSPLRISGPVQMWLHYDVMANVLCQVRGAKRVVLFPPADVAQLGFDAGASSSSLDVFAALSSPNGISSRSSSPSLLANTHPLETTLQPGDILLIPPMWAHATAPAPGGTSVAVNVFFRNLAIGYAAGRDVYGNRDLAAYEKGRKDVTKMVHSFDDLPDDVAGFYLERLAMELREKARVLAQNGSVERS